MPREIQEARESEDSAQRTTPQPPQPQTMQGEQILALQRSAGNHAVAAALVRATLSRNGEGATATAAPAGPSGGGGDPWREIMELIAKIEETLKKDEEPASEEGSGAEVEGVAEMFSEAEAEAEAAEIERRFRATLAKAGPGGGEGITDESTEGVSTMFEGAESEAAARQAQLDSEQAADDALYANVTKLAAALDDPKVKKSHRKMKAAHKALQAGFGSWKASLGSRLKLPRNLARRQQLEVMISEKLWVVDEKKSDDAALQRDPDLLKEDRSGYFVPMTADVQKIDAKGKLEPAILHFNKDQYFKDGDLKKGRKGGISGYTWGSYFIHGAAVEKKKGGFEEVAGPLFPEDPKPEHVEQTTLGDCYLQAAVASLAGKNPGYVKSMMRDNEDETVTVRLFKINDSKAEKHTYSAKYVRVRKSVPKDFRGNEVYNAGALWVRLLEKAYAAGGFGGDTTVAPKKSYKNIEGGWGWHSIEVLTGEMAASYAPELSGPQVQSDESYATSAPSTGSKKGSLKKGHTRARVPWEEAEIKAHEEAKADGTAYDDLLSHQILGDNARVDTWMDFVKTWKLHNMFMGRRNDRAKGYAVDVTLSDVEDAMQTLSSGIKADMMAWIEAQKLYPGKLGEAKYSAHQLEIFEKVKDSLDSGGMVTGSTFEFPGGAPATGTGMSGGEVQHEGIVGNHVYSFLSVRQNASSNPDSDNTAGDFRYIKVRNPWGSYGREYDMSNAAQQTKAKEGAGTGTFWLELSELTKFFDVISYG